MRILLLLVPLWSGCLVTDKMVRELVDTDGDGFTEIGFHGDELQGGKWPNGTDCDDEDPDIHPEAVEVCMDAKDNDCDGLVDEDGKGDVLVFHDIDEDGFGNAYDSRSMCTPNKEWVINAGDCDDRNSYINPFQLEACDGLDNDCDGEFDDNAPQIPWYRDADGDSFGTVADLVLSCQPPAGYVPNPDDCDDDDPAAFPGADDAAYDGVDADCAKDSDYDLDGDGFFHAASGTTQPDCDDVEPSIHPGAPEVWYDGVDQDCDPHTEWDQDRDGFPWDSDCDDTTALRRPGLPETWYDGIDQDCDPSTEWDQDGDGLTVVTAPMGDNTDCDDRTSTVLGPSVWYLDLDQDGWGDPLQAVSACARPAGHVDRPDDCDDRISAIHPEATETCAPGDEDCDGLTDEAGGYIWYPDNDGDSYGDSRFRGVETCHPPFGAVTRAEDCDDLNIDVHPGATELCNGLDDDCDGTSDQVGGRDLRRDLWPDLDGDGVGAITEPAHSCAELLTDHATRTGDCDDADGAVFPGAAEVCDGVDNNCRAGLDDEGRQTRWFDADGDGFGAGAPGWECPDAYDDTWVLADGDCDDSAPTLHPAATEVCDHLDNNCDNLLDIAGGRSLYVPRYVDGDGDGWGVGGVVSACADEVGYAEHDGDCADTDADRFPGHEERCDEVDQDCDGVVSDDGRQPWYLDDDGDGAGSADAPPGWLEAYPYEVCQELLPSGLPWLTAGGDCDDANASIRPGAREVCDYLDNNCNGMGDELPLRVEHWGDQDGDGVGGPAAPQPACDLRNDPLVRISGDCDDADEDRFPGNPERCDEVDQDCDGDVSDDGRQPWYLDEDDDGVGSTDVPAEWSQRTGGAPYPPVVCAELLSPLFHWEAAAGDCDDANAAVRPGAAETCDYVDSNCNGWADERTTPHFPDEDDDGAGLRGVASTQRCPGTSGWVENQRDCDDDDADRFEGNPERCDEVDQDCDGDVADDGRRLWWYDHDGDGYGATWAGRSPLEVCASLLSDPTRWVTRGEDCDDRVATVSPGQPEVCDSIDNDCNPATPEPTLPHYPDADRDSYGDASVSSPTMRCRMAGDAWVEDHTDCDDQRSQIHPRAADVCDEVDQDCDGDPWEGQDVEAVVDWDHDGYGEAGARPTTVCRSELCPLIDAVDGVVADAGRDAVDPLSGEHLEPCWSAWTADFGDDDCEDDDHATHPNAVEICDGRRNTCDECSHVDGRMVPATGAVESVCEDAERFVWDGSVYLRKNFSESWQDGADWCHERGYKLWWPTQRRAWLLSWRMEPFLLGVGGYLSWSDPTDYHTGIESGRLTDDPQTVAWMMWDPVTRQYQPLSSTSEQELGLGTAVEGKVVVITLEEDPVVAGWPRFTAAATDYNAPVAITVCELDYSTDLDDQHLLPESNPQCR